MQYQDLKIPQRMSYGFYTRNIILCPEFQHSVKTSGALITFSTVAILRRRFNREILKHLSTCIFVDGLSSRANDYHARATISTIVILKR